MKNARFELFDLKAAAAGRWPEIHAAVGIPAHLLDTRKHQPCPYCGGKDRYRYTDHQNTGGFICNQCTPAGGSGFDLLMLVYGYDFPHAAHEVAALLGMAADAVRPSERTAPRILPAMQPLAVSDKQDALAAIWQQGQPIDGTPAALYLQARGLSADTVGSAGNIRFHAALPYWALRCQDGKAAAPLLIGYYPAMLAAITDTAGNLQGLHQTYVQPDSDGHTYRKLQAQHPDTGETLPAKKMQSRYPKALHGAAVHLAAPDHQGRLMVAEGIETALAAMELFSLPAIAALSANGMKALQWPSAVQELFICADNDQTRTGILAAHALAVKAIKAGIKANIWQPDTSNSDALDELNRRNSKGIQS